MLFFVLTNKLNVCLIYILQYLLQFLLNIYYCAKKLYTIFDILFRLFALKSKYNNNRLLILNKIDNFTIDI